MIRFRVPKFGGGQTLRHTGFPVALNNLFGYFLLFIVVIINAMPIL